VSIRGPSVREVPLKGLSAPDRPREKLSRTGAGALGDHELVALVLGAGTQARDALSVAQDLIAAAGGSDGLARLSADELRRIPGVGLARAARLLAAVELGRRALVREAGERPQFRSPADVAHYLMPLHGAHRLERFGVMLLDLRQRLIRTTILSMGTEDAAPAQPREVFREALLASASAVVVFHNHPSGDPQPSADDVLVTARLSAAGELVGVELVDHIVLGSGRYFSFRAKGMLRKAKRT
jgi:DNA repair protein RadC